MSCKEQEMEVTGLIEGKIQEAIQFLSNKSLKEAIAGAERINNIHFYGNNVIIVSPNKSSREDGITEVYFNNKARQEAISDKIADDNRIEMDERIRELKAGYNFYMNDDMPSTPTYDEFDYSSVVSNKMLLKEKLEKQRNLLKNKGKGKEQLEQIEYLNETIRKLHIDITKLQKSDETLSNYLKSISDDIDNVRELLKNPTLDNIQAINNYLEILKLFTSDKPGGFLTTPLSKIKDIDSDIWSKLAATHSSIELLEEQANTIMTEIIKDTIKFHIEQKEQYQDWDETQIQEEVERLYQNQITKSIGKMSFVKSQVTMLDRQEERNVLISVLYKVYTDALAKNNNKEKRKQLSNIKDKVETELKKLGRTKGSGFNKRADQSIFLRQSETSHQLIGKFSEDWVNFKRKAKAAQNKISEILYKGDKTQMEIEAIQKQFDDLKDNVDFIDVTRIPEFVNDPEFSHYAASFMSSTYADSYKAELIAKIGEREYNKVVDEQRNKIYAYEIFKSVKEARLRDTYNLEETDDLQSNIPEKEWNSHLHFLYSKSPFIFSENFRNKGNNIITKPYYVNGQKFLSENTPADLEYISYTPKKEEFFDSNFSQIENNPVLNEAWTYMADLVEYNNENGFNQNPDNLTEYSLASQQKRVKSFPARLIGLFSKKTLNTLHSNMTTTKYQNPDEEHLVAGQRVNVDQDIQRLYEAKIKGYKDPSKATRDAVMKEAKEIIMKNQDEDLIDNILASTEITEKFKAKREIENKINFIKNHIETQTDRKRFKELIQFFRDKELYEINNRTNFNRLGGEFNFSDIKGLGWTKFYSEKEKEIRKASKESLKQLKKYLDEAKTPEETQEIQKEIDSINEFLKSGGKVLTPGSLIEAWVIKLARVAAFSLNFSAQLTNMTIANVNAREVDGKLGFWKAGVYHDAVSFSRKWKSVSSDSKTKKEIRTGELLLQRLQLFQNSANEIFKIEKSRAASSIGAVLENPMNFVSEVEKTIQRPQIFALISEIKVKGENGVEVPMFDPKTRSFPAFSSDSEGNLILAEGFDTQENRETFLLNTSQEYANLFGDGGKVPSAIAYINGDYRQTSTYLFEKNTLTAIGFLFKRWAVLTVDKKFGVMKRLGENDHSGIANSALFMQAGVYSLATGALFGPIGLGAGLALYTFYHGQKKIRAEIKDGIEWSTVAQRALINAKAIPKSMYGLSKGSLRLSLAVAAQSVGMIIDPLTKRQLINSDHIKRIIGNKDKKSDGTEFTLDEIREVQEDIYFLSTSIATTVKFLAMRALVMMALYPDEDEEQAHKDRVNKGDTFWTRAAADPDTAMYYILENMLSGFIDDSNMLVNFEGLQRMGDLQGEKYNTYYKDITRMIKGEGELKSGPNQGENALKVHLLRYNTPAVLKDGFSLGFGSRSQKDFDSQNIIDQIKRPVLEKINEARLEARRKTKKELEDSKEYRYDSPENKKKKIDKKLKLMYPVIKETDLDSEGNLLKYQSYKWRSYWKK